MAAEKKAFDYVNDIWSIADYVRDVIRPADYNKLILPFAVLHPVAGGGGAPPPLLYFLSTDTGTRRTPHSRRRA